MVQQAISVAYDSFYLCRSDVGYVLSAGGCFNRIDFYSLEGWAASKNWMENLSSTY